MLVSLVRAPNSDGTVPVNWLVPRLIQVRLVRVPNSVGKVPISWMVPTFKTVHEAGAVIQF